MSYPDNPEVVSSYSFQIYEEMKCCEYDQSDIDKPLKDNLTMITLEEVCSNRL
jgi:hypothetical protein